MSGWNISGVQSPRQSVAFDLLAACMFAGFSSGVRGSVLKVRIRGAKECWGFYAMKDALRVVVLVHDVNSIEVRSRVGAKRFDQKFKSLGAFRRFIQETI